MPLLALRLAQPTILIDINRVPGLDAISLRPGGGLRIGALTRHRSLARGQHPLLAEAARWVGHTAIRTRGTLGGSLAHADPAAEAAAGEIEPASDIHASAGYRRQLTRVLVTRALTRAAGAQAAAENNPCR